MDEKIVIHSSGESLEITPHYIPIEVIRKKAIESTNQLLDTEDVAQIVYIDDKFDIESQREVFKGALFSIKRDQNYIESDYFNDIDWDSPEPRFESLISSLWENTVNKSELLYEVCTHLKDEQSINIIPALDLGNCFGERIKLMTPNEWYSDNYGLIKSIGENQKVLCLFDFQFHSGHDLVEGKNGVQLAKKLLEQEDISNKIICGIFSHTFSEEEEDEYRNKYSKDYGIEITKFYTISKLRFSIDPKIIAFA
ncbi:MAG: hypothetical protein ACK4UK_09660, partial [Flavobacterium sp.]